MSEEAASWNVDLFSHRLPLAEALPLERHYVISKAVHLGYDLREDFRAYRHAVATDTCAEKAKLLQDTLPGEQWMPNRVVKALYGVVDWDPYVFVLPELRGECSFTERSRIMAAVEESGVR